MTAYEQAIVDAGIREHMRPWGIDGYDYYQTAESLGFPKGWQDTIGRDSFVSRFSWAIPDDHALQVIAEHAPILEVGAGSGYWAHELAARGVDIIATDPEPGGSAKDSKRGYRFDKLWHPVEKMDGLAALKAYPDRTLLMVWPCYDRAWASDVLSSYEGKTVLYVGEGDGGCTGDERFHRLLEEQFNARTVRIPQWWGLHDQLYVYGRRARSEKGEH